MGIDTQTLLHILNVNQMESIWFKRTCKSHEQANTVSLGFWRSRVGPLAR